MTTIDEVKAELAKPAAGGSPINPSGNTWRDRCAFLLAEVERLQRLHDSWNDMSEAAKQILETEEISTWLPKGTRILNVTADAWEALEERAEKAERERDAYKADLAKADEVLSITSYRLTATLIDRDEARDLAARRGEIQVELTGKLAEVSKDRNQWKALAEAKPDISAEDAALITDVVVNGAIDGSYVNGRRVSAALRAHAQKGGR